MKFVKIKISIIQRVKEIIDGIDWLSMTVIDVHNPDGTWHEERYPFIDRWNCFINSIDTAIIGYVYGLEPSKSSEYVPL